MNTVHQGGIPRLIAIPGGLSVPAPRLTLYVRPSEADAAALLREEWTQTDPATGRVLWTVDAYDEEAYAMLLQDEEWSLRPDAEAYGLSSAARASLGLFTLAAIEDDLRGARAS